MRDVSIFCDMRKTSGLTKKKIEARVREATLQRKKTICTCLFVQDIPNCCCYRF